MDDCPTDEELIAFALGKLESARLPSFHAHLDACGTCQLVLAEAAHAFATAVTAPMSEDVDWNTTFQRGALVAGRYVISRFIARGAMGEVYEAYDRELAERVALKTVASTACDNTRAVRRLKAEVQLARRVSHQNVCRIYDFGTHVMPETGVQLHFLTMEFVEGETLGQRVRLGGALPVLEAFDIARELLLALRAAHAAGVLHRDFKSDNVMLKLASPERVTPVVLDFGLARAVDHQPAASASRSTFVGTFGYMAPELLEGMPHSTASDVYAFGVVWFEMLTGQLPFEGAATPALALKCLQSPAPAPSSLNRALSGVIDELVLRCLERSPRDRFRTASEVLEALEVAGADGKSSSTLEPVATSTDGQVDSGHSWLPKRGPGRRRGLIAAAAAVGAASSLVAWVLLGVPSPAVRPAQPGLSTALETPAPNVREASLERSAKAPATTLPSLPAPPSAPAASPSPPALLSSVHPRPPAHSVPHVTAAAAPSEAPIAPAPAATPAVTATAAGSTRDFAVPAAAPSTANTARPEAAPVEARPQAKPRWENPFEKNKAPR